MSGIVVGGVAVAAIGAATSYAQAQKQKRLKRQANKAAENAMEEAKSKLDVNVYEALSIKKEPYELAREASLAQGKMALQAAQEGDVRGAAATAGRVQMAQNKQQQQIQSAMGQEALGLEKTVASEEARLMSEKSRIDLQEAEGAQVAAAEAAKAQAAYESQAMESGMQALGGAVAIGSGLVNKGKIGKMDWDKTFKAYDAINNSFLIQQKEDK
jgi:hypothetical protein|tara:strand:- start:12 stop:653 length:642 start_codon:yes stop_codon:yes gene_type:complete